MICLHTEFISSPVRELLSLVHEVAAPAKLCLHVFLDGGKMTGYLVTFLSASSSSSTVGVLELRVTELGEGLLKGKRSGELFSWDWTMQSIF